MNILIFREKNIQNKIFLKKIDLFIYLKALENNFSYIKNTY